MSRFIFQCKDKIKRVPKNRVCPRENTTFFYVLNKIILQIILLYNNHLNKLKDYDFKNSLSSHLSIMFPFKIGNFGKHFRAMSIHCPVDLAKTESLFLEKSDATTSTRGWSSNIEFLFSEKQEHNQPRLGSLHPQWKNLP